MGDARIVDENVDLSERLLCVLAKIRHGRAVAQIAREHEHARAELGGKLVELFGAGA